MILHLTPDERKRSRALIAAALCVEGSLRLFWHPIERRIITRKLASERNVTLPPEAQLVGEYAHPYPSQDIIDDLEAHLAKQDAITRAAA